MPYWPPDSPPSEPEQMPQATSPGPAPVPYGGPGFALAPDMLAPQPAVNPGSTPGSTVMGGVTGSHNVSEAPLRAPNVNPYDAGSPQPIYVGGDNDPGGRDDVANAVAAAVAAAEARFGELRGDQVGQGAHIGDLMSFPVAPLDPGVGSLGETDPSGGFFDPPRNY